MSLPHFIDKDLLFAGFAGKSGLARQGNGDKSQHISIDLPKPIIKHMQTARLKPGEQFVLSDGRGTGWQLELVGYGQKSVPSVSAKYVSELIATAVPKVTLIQGVAAADRMDLVVRQATELGIYRIIPLLAGRSTVRIDATNSAQKLERWRRVSLAAGEQSGLLSLPQIEPAQDLESALQATANCSPKICPWEEATSGALSEAVAGSEFNGDQGAVLIVGPEGGFSALEVEAMLAAGFSTVSLGATLLRTETAATVASALLLHELGGLGNSYAR